MLAAGFALALPLSAQAQSAHSAREAVAQSPTPTPSPGEIVAAAPVKDWVAIAPADLLVMTLAPDRDGKPRQAIIQLMPPPFSQGWVGNIRKLAAAHWWDGLSINRVQDNYVVQWGDGNAEDAKKAKPLPEGLAVMAESEYIATLGRGQLGEKDKKMAIFAVNSNGHPAEQIITMTDTLMDPYAGTSGGGLGLPGFHHGWPVAARMSETENASQISAWPVHCYGMVGVGRDLSPNTGSGAELYVVIGHAPRHLDRNIALVGRVIEGIEHLSSLPRGTGGLGFYETAKERTKIRSIRLGAEVKRLPTYEYLSTESTSFAKYADARANRRDAFFIRPAGGADICNIPVPVRRVK